MIESLARLYDGVYATNRHLLSILEGKELPAPEQGLLDEFAENLHDILEQTKGLERTAVVLLNVASGQMN